MTTNKKLANYTGKTTLPSVTDTDGSYVAPSEVYQQKLIDAWPVAPSYANPWVTAGDFVFAISSGVVTAISGVKYCPCDGSTASRTVFGALYSGIGNTYGSGNGSTTFTLPNTTPIYGYFKAATVSGTTPSGVGVLPTHTHTIFPLRTYQTPQASNGNGGVTDMSNPTFTTNNAGGNDNHGRHYEIIPLVASISENLPVGLAMAFLTPNDAANISLVIATNVMIASGQAISRNTYATLYSRIGNLYGSGDGSTTFNLPDYRGIFLRAPVGRTTLQPSGYAGVSGWATDNFISHNHTVSSNVLAGGNRRCDYTAPTNGLTTPVSSTSNIGTGNESRPANIDVYLAVVVLPI